MFIHVFASQEKVDSFSWKPESIKEMKMASVKVEKGMTREQHQTIIEDIMTQLFASEVIGVELKEATATTKAVPKTETKTETKSKKLKKK